MVNWSETLNLERALVNCRNDIVGDWYRDPYGWPELNWVLKANREDLLVSRLNADRVGRVLRLDVPKENFAYRPAVILDPLDRLCYQALVDRLSVGLIGGMSPSVYGWRLEPSDPKPGHYVRNDYQWTNFRERLKDGAATHGAALLTDIVSCFASVSVSRMADTIATRCGNDGVVDRLVGMLEAWDGMADRTGLPQRSLASCVLANAYLRPLDDILAHFGRKSVPKRRRIQTARWMDDIWLFGRDPGVLRAAQLDLQMAMADMRLNMNFAKTRQLDGADLAVAVERLEHSGADAGLAAIPVDRGPLDDIIDGLIHEPETADRTTIRFATLRMRKNHLFDRVEELAACAERMPHGADYLARLFKESGAWRDLGNWYVNYAASPWGKVEWAVAQLGTMFPSGTKPPRGVRDFMAERLVTGGSLPMAAVAAQRLAAWGQADARVAIREAGKRAENPLERRVLGLAAVGLGEERDIVRRLLREYEENAVTAAMVDAKKFRPFKVTADFL